MSVYSDNRQKTIDGINESYKSAKHDDNYIINQDDKDLFDSLKIKPDEEYFQTRCASQESMDKIIRIVEKYSDFKYSEFSNAFCRPGEVYLIFKKINPPPVIESSM